MPLTDTVVIHLQVDIPYFTPGDTVRVLDDIAKVHELQKETVGWVDEMALVHLIPYIGPVLIV